MVKLCQHRLTQGRMSVQEAYFIESYCDLSGPDAALSLT